MVPLEDMHHRLARTWSPVSHLNGVLNSDELRAAYNACLPLLTAWHTELAQNEQPLSRVRDVLENEGPRSAAAQRKLLENALRDFRLAGVALPQDTQAAFKALMEQLAPLQAKFDENVLDATQAWSRTSTDETAFAGLPRADRSSARAPRAGRRQARLAVHARCAELPGRADARRERGAAPRVLSRLGHARIGSGPPPERWDNSALMAQILALRSRAGRPRGLRQLRRVLARDQDGVVGPRSARLPAQLAP